MSTNMLLLNKGKSIISLEESVMNTLLDTIPITKFNRGQAGKIFGEIKEMDGVKVVVKNNEPEVVIISPSMYNKLISLYNREKEKALYQKIANRIAAMDRNAKTYSEADIMKEFGISEEDILNAPDDIDDEI